METPLLTQLSAVFRGTFSHYLLKLGVEIIHVAVAHFFRYFINLQSTFLQQLQGGVNTHPIQISREIHAYFLGEELSQIGAVIAKKRRDPFQLKVIHVIMPDIINDIIQGAFPGGGPKGTQNHFRLFGDKGDDFIQIIPGIDKIRRPAARGKRDIRGMIMITDSFPDLKIEIKEKTPDILDGDGGEVDLFPEPAESFRQQTPVPCLNIIHQHVPV